MSLLTSTSQLNEIKEGNEITIYCQPSKPACEHDLKGRSNTPSIYSGEATTSNEHQLVPVARRDGRSLCGGRSETGNYGRRRPTGKEVEGGRWSLLSCCRMCGG